MNNTTWNTVVRHSRIVAAGLASASFLLTVAFVIGVEQYTTYKLRGVGWNYRGYRGRVLTKKRRNELRVFAIGGSTTYGFTVQTDESYPFQLERKLNARLSDRGIKVSVANLGHLSDSSVCYYPTYRDYEYLEPEIVIIYEGYNDVSVPTRRIEFDCYRQSSAIFRWTGFFPTSPIFFKERWYKLRYGSIQRGYEMVLERNRLKEEERKHWNAPAPALPVKAVAPPPGPSLTPYEIYERNVLAFVEFLLGEGKGVVFASQPYLGNLGHLEQQMRIRAALRPYRSNPRFRYRDFLYLFGGRWDARWFNAQMWLNASGNEILAEHFVEPVMELILNDPMRGALEARGAIR